MIGTIATIFVSLYRAIVAAFNGTFTYLSTLVREVPDSFEAVASVFPFVPVWFVPVAVSIMSIGLFLGVVKGCYK